MLIIGSIIAVIIIIIIIFIVAKKSYNKGDYGDGGGIQIGGSSRIPFFIPANDRAGLYGEKFINYHLKTLLRKDEYLLANILLPLKNGHKTEIDSVLITRKGIFCIEIKNWIGHISGNDEDEYWVQTYDDPTMNDKRHRNPVKQNNTHCSVLERKLNNNFTVFGAVIFAKLENRYGINSNSTYTIQGFKKYFRSLSEDVISPEKLERIFQNLRVFVSTEDQLKQHRDEIMRKFGNN